MMEEFQYSQIAPGVRLALIKSGKFKTDLVSVYLKRPLSKEEATMNTLLARVIERGTRRFPTTQSFNAHLDDLYGAMLYSDVTKIGELHVLQFKTQLPRSPWILEMNPLKEAIELLRELIYEPALEDGGFIPAYVDQEIENLQQEIESRTNDKTTYAMDRMVEHMCPDEPYSAYTYGDVTYLKGMNAKRLYGHYLKVLAEAEVDIVVFGDFDFDQATNWCREAFVFGGPRQPLPVSSPWTPRIPEVHRIIERTQINQAKLVIGYRTPVSGAHPLYYPALLFSTVLGGTPSSRLFNRIREQESLCYYVQSKFDRFKGMLIVTAGIDKTSDARATELVDEVFKDMLEGQITQDELENARKSIVTGLRSITDYPNSYSNFLFSQWMTEETLDIELIIQKLNAVEIEEVTSAGRLFVKDTWYLLTGEENQ